MNRFTGMNFMTNAGQSCPTPCPPPCPPHRSHRPAGTDRTNGTAGSCWSNGTAGLPRSHRTNRAAGYSRQRDYDWRNRTNWA